MNITILVPMVFIAAIAFTVGTLVNTYVIPNFLPSLDLTQIIALAGGISISAFLVTWLMLALYVRAKVRR